MTPVDEMVALLGLGFALSGVLLAVLAGLQRRFLYLPVREDLARATERTRRVGVEPWSSGGRFLGWRGASSAPPRVASRVPAPP